MAPLQFGPEAVARRHPNRAARLRPSARAHPLELVALSSARISDGQAAQAGKQLGRQRTDDWH